MRLNHWRQKREGGGGGRSAAAGAAELVFFFFFFKSLGGGTDGERNSPGEDEFRSKKKVTAERDRQHVGMARASAAAPSPAIRGGRSDSPRSWWETGEIYLEICLRGTSGSGGLAVFAQTFYARIRFTTMFFVFHMKQFFDEAGQNPNLLKVRFERRRKTQ